ncbi:MAG: DUF4197 domain-containing protein [Pseudomonadota bacterium]
MKKKLSASVCFFSLLVVQLVVFPSASPPLQAGWLEKGADVLKNSVPGTATSLSQPSLGDVTAGLKDALRVGSETVVGNLGRQDGFNLDPKIHIPLPEKMRIVQDALKKVGMSSMVDDLETRLNRAAEIATPRAKELFHNAISEMTLDDAMAIYKGPDDAATKYFQKKLTPQLTAEMTPVVSESLAETDAVKSYDNVMSKYQSIPFVPDVKADLTAHVVDKGLAGIFYYLAQEEASIRKNPAKRTTEILQKIFR